MDNHDLLESLRTANELIAKQRQEIEQLRLAVALLKYHPPKRETRGRKLAIHDKQIKNLVTLEPIMKEHFAKTKERYARNKWVYIALLELGLVTSSHRAKNLQLNAIKRMSSIKVKIPK